MKIVRYKHPGIHPVESTDDHRMEPGDGVRTEPPGGGPLRLEEAVEGTSGAPVP